MITITALGEVVAKMRELGVSHLKTADMELTLSDAPAAPKQMQDQEGDSDVRADVSARREWERFWSQATKASGAPIPPYPKPRPKMPGMP